MQKDFAVVEFCPYTVAKNFQSEQQYLPDKTKNETKINFWPTDNISIIQALHDVLTWLIIKDQSIFLGNHFITSHNLFTSLCIDIVRGKLILFTLRASCRHPSIFRRAHLYFRG